MKLHPFYPLTITRITTDPMPKGDSSLVDVRTELGGNAELETIHTLKESLDPVISPCIWRTIHNETSPR